MVRFLLSYKDFHKTTEFFCRTENKNIDKKYEPI